MFLTYLQRELRQRIRQTVAVSLGLALGIGLVITVTAVSAGLRDAQSSVLRSLYGVSSTFTVTQPPLEGTASPAPSPSPLGRGSTGAAPSGGGPIRQDNLFSRQLGPLPSTSVTSISRLAGVTAATGGLSLTDLRVIGAAPAVRPASPPPTPSPSGSRPPPLNTKIFSVAGVEPSISWLGPFSSITLTAGRLFTAAEADASLAVLDAAYAQRQNLQVGSVITVAGADITVVGTGSQPSGARGADVYLPLTYIQRLAGMADQVNVVYVTAASAGDVDRLRPEIAKLLPSAIVTTSSDVAATITGSLSTASSLANDLGRWLAIAVLAAAFLMASLLTVATVSRRVREFGTLKALGWPTKRVVGQVMGEAIVTGVLGGAIGVGLGYGVAALISALAPSLTADVGQAAGTPGQGGVGAAANVDPVVVHLTAPVAPSAILLAVALAIAGGLVAGSFGGWRAARLRPAAALARVA